MNSPPVGRTVMIADDHRLFAEGVATILREQHYNTIIVTELAQIEPILASSRPELLVLDLAFGETSAMPLLRKLRVSYKRMPILVISASEESVIVERVLETGAAYLAKSQAGSDVAQVVDALLKGVYEAPKQKQHRATSKRNKLVGGVTLTRNQLEVLHLVQLGKTNSEISQSMRRAIKTIEAHMAELYARTGLNSRGSLIRWASEHRKKLAPDKDDE